MTIRNQKVVVGLIQTASLKDPARNLKKTEALILRAARRGAQIICLQELFKTDYFCQTYNHSFFDLAEAIPGPSTQVFSKIARQKSVAIIASLFEKRVAGLYHNTAAVIDAGGKFLGKYRKMHIPDDPNFYEKFYFTPGDLGYKVFKTKFANIGVLICWDQWFPEAARLTALQGAQILFYPTAIGWHDSEPKEVAKAQLQGWQTIQRGHAVANEVFVAAVNRVGKEGPVKFWGNSFVSDPFGGVLAKAGEDDEEILIAECNLSQIEEVRRGWPFLRDRRIDSYQALTTRFNDEK